MSEFLIALQSLHNTEMVWSAFTVVFIFAPIIVEFGCGE